MILRAYKYRIYPNVTQQKQLNETFGCVRFVWNQLVQNFNSWNPDNPPPKISEKTLKDTSEYSFLKEVSSAALQQKRMDFDEAKSQFFNKKRKTKQGRMRFKKKGVHNDSFRISGQALGFNECADFNNGTIRLPKIGKIGKIKAVFDREFKGQLRSVTVSRNKCNQYFVSALVQEEVQALPITGRSVGIDLGLTHLATLSSGVKINNPRWFRESQSELKRAQQHLSRKVKGSSRYKKQRQKVARVHLSTSNRRSWHHHNLSTWLVQNYDDIIMENLCIRRHDEGDASKVSSRCWVGYLGQDDRVQGRLVRQDVPQGGQVLRKL